MQKLPFDLLGCVSSFVGKEFIAKSHLNKTLSRDFRNSKQYFDSWLRFRIEYLKMEQVKSKCWQHSCWFRAIESKDNPGHIKIAAASGKTLQALITIHHELFRPIFERNRIACQEAKCHCESATYPARGGKKCVRQWNPVKIFDEFCFKDFNSKVLFCHADLLPIYETLGIEIQDIHYKALSLCDFGHSTSPAFTDGFHNDPQWTLLIYDGYRDLKERIEEYILYHNPSYGDVVVKAFRDQIRWKSLGNRYPGDYHRWGKSHLRPWEPRSSGW